MTGVNAVNAADPVIDDPVTGLRQCFARAVALAGAAYAIRPDDVPPVPRGRTFVLALGKAGAALAARFAALWPRDARLSGIALVPDGHGLSGDGKGGENGGGLGGLGGIELVYGAHPVPDARGQAATRRVMAAVQALGKDDLFVCLLSGGGSALLNAPATASGISAADKQDTNRQLLSAGVPIGAMNALRKHISAVKGGRLATLARPARVYSLAISDVPGDALTSIASGPTVPDPSTRADALAVLARLPNPPDAVRDWLARAHSETPKSGPAFAGDVARVTITPDGVLAQVADEQRAAGLAVVYQGAELEGDAALLGAEHARWALAHQCNAHAASPTLLLSGGETSVTLSGASAPSPSGDKARGGRNAHYALALFTALAGAAGIWALAADTDGIDGSGDNAGAWFGPDDWARARARRLDPAAYLAANDSYGFWQAMDRLVMTGPTRTNINDFRALLVLPTAK